MIRSEATDIARQRGPLKTWVRRLFLRAIYGQCSRFLAIGQIARQHFLTHGVRPELVFFSPYCVDTALFERQAQLYLPQRADLRRSLGFADDDFLLIFSGKLMRQKDPLTLARALQGIPLDRRRSLGLIVVGDGELRVAFEAACRDALGERAVFLGFVNQSEIGQFYASADCLVLPSLGETWGLVVNEALQFGLPAIVSNCVSCHPDLIIKDETGYLFPVGDAGALRECVLSAMDRLFDTRLVTAARCREQVAAYSEKRAAAGICDAIYSCRSLDGW